ncbi:nuclear transport factor 2 family protein [Paenarthrobacter ureafaciens]|uniref:nuclear transport factor 2 family protein n=1 Tax=Paenarthrobacter TaxID=1742992 RepID=UPI0015BB323D|nr:MULTISPECIES: nuclear transport factor 2 family protein [Paenarthrobacter]NWL26747.1 nuclear transport factor 2 family protein [Paenarthrobacter ureafaciens]NWL31983.1 nuclear transport factor 2 family protein [Paenarthrobacter nitroguajacolicus]
MTQNAAAQIATAYFEAWTSKNVDEATQFLTEDIVITAPNGTFSGHAGFHAFMDGFVKMLTGVSDFTVFGDETTAVAWYNTHLQPVPSLVAGERVTVTDGKISRIDITFDQMPLAQAFGGAAPAHDAPDATV